MGELILGAAAAGAGLIQQADAEGKAKKEQDAAVAKVKANQKKEARDLRLLEAMTKDYNYYTKLKSAKTGTAGTMFSRSLGESSGPVL